MEFKKMIIILTITITIIFGITLGISYGWYAYQNAESNVIGSTINEKPTVIFAQTEYIESTTTTPIYDEDRYNYANKNSFTITVGPNLENYEVAIEVYLTDINISEELKIANYKYELLEDKKLIANGNFASIGSANSLKILPMSLLTPKTYPKAYTYELYIWLSDDNTNQNNLMNKGFSAKVNINSAVKSK